MAQTDSSNTVANNMAFSPPPLPEYLSRNLNLEVIVGVPTDEQAKAIHDTIRAVNSVSNVPALYDSKLSTQLAQYLFTIQMAVYRNEYPLNLFPGENTYMPPSVPSHIPISLEPVVGAPSDGQLEAAHNAARTLENLANSPFFDSTLSVKLSQHVFNIQFARYIQDSNQGCFIRPANLPLPPQINADELSSTVVSGHISNEVANQAPQDAGLVELSLNPSGISARASSGSSIGGVLSFSGAPSNPSRVPSSLVGSEPAPLSQPDDKLGNICDAQLDTNRLLSRSEELLKDIRRTLVSTHSITVHAGDSTSSSKTINEKGEQPWVHHRKELGVYRDIMDGSRLKFNRSVTDQEFARYLGFYGIGANLTDETGSIKPDKKEDAQSLLKYYLFTGGLHVS
ncbi:hypothetical protein RSOLAG22IIIB_11477 [Rhizoctonia solani]|uniref:Uncharacterized protein n=1 Tax=Rhizoctonia solani TaxID=456999 RepID=A0A0K6G8I6_9AGAM|nr:hypothetical protein RSOLAG22IIIB_11477 [Rhizoctonia solani]